MSRWVPKFIGLASVCAAILGWELIATSGFFGDTLPAASTSFAACIELLSVAETWWLIGVTVYTAVFGLGISAIIGVVLGVLLGTSKYLAAATRVVIEFLKPIPPIVILPVAVLVLGPKVDMALFLVVFGCMLPIAVQTAAGVMETNPVALETARSFQLTRFQTLYRVVFPSATPFIANAIRVNAPASLIIAVVAGLFGGAPGVGYLLYRAVQTVDSPNIFALVIITGTIGLLFQLISTALERRLLPWSPAIRQAVKA